MAWRQDRRRHAKAVDCRDSHGSYHWRHVWEETVFAILEISASVIGICILVCYSVACVKGFLMCDVRMIVCRLLAMSKWSELFLCMIILVYRAILIVAFVEMAGTYDRGGWQPQRSGIWFAIDFHLTVQGQSTRTWSWGSLLVLVVQWPWCWVMAGWERPGCSIALWFTCVKVLKNFCLACADDCVPVCRTWVYDGNDLHADVDYWLCWDGRCPRLGGWSQR